MAERPSRGDVWELDLDPVRGREQAGRRSGLVVSADALNRGPSELIIVLPITSVDKKIRFHVAVEPSEGGLRSRSFIKPEDIRSISTERARRRLGTVSADTIRAVGARLRILLEL